MEVRGYRRNWRLEQVQSRRRLRPDGTRPHPADKSPRRHIFRHARSGPRHRVVPHRYRPDQIRPITISRPSSGTACNFWPDPCGFVASRNFVPQQASALTENRLRAKNHTPRAEAMSCDAKSAGFRHPPHELLGQRDESPSDLFREAHGDFALTRPTGAAGKPIRSLSPPPSAARRLP
jgi:hypothetical protein